VARDARIEDSFDRGRNCRKRFILLALDPAEAIRIPKIGLEILYAL
jgi:hypothetical protein